MHTRSDRGAVLLEFALVIALLAALATGIADAGIAFRIKHVLKIAAREWARGASATPGLQLPNDSRVLPDVVDKILQESNIDLAEGTITVGPKGLATNEPVTVEVTYDYDPLFPAIGLGLGGPLTLRSSTTMRYEVVGS